MYVYVSTPINKIIFLSIQLGSNISYTNNYALLNCYFYIGDEVILRTG